MKILAVSHLFPNAQETRYGIFVARQLAAMATEGAKIELLVPRLYSPAWMNSLLGRQNRMDHTSSLLSYPGIQGHSIPYFAFPGKSFKRRAGVAMYRAVRKTAIRLHEKLQFEALYGTDWFLGADVARRLGNLLRIPSAGLAIGDDVNITANQSRKDHQRFVEIANGLSSTLACGDSLAHCIDAVRTGTPTLSVYGVVDLERFHPLDDKHALRERLQLPVTERLLLYAGYLWQRKGIIELIAAFEAVCRGNPAYLVLCGTGEDETMIRQRAQKSEFADRILFQGSVSPNDMHLYMQAADLLVLPSYSEGMPNVVMEAMACGLPVVCTAVGGIPEAVGDSPAAKLVPPRDSKALAAAIREVMAEEGGGLQRGVEARKLAEAKFDVRGNARRILAHIETAVQEESSSRRP